jgi:hypothetical protein
MAASCWRDVRGGVSVIKAESFNFGVAPAQAGKAMLPKRKTA